MFGAYICIRLPTGNYIEINEKFVARESGNEIEYTDL